MPACDVKRLDDHSARLRKGDQVLAVFPETTSFYRATVVKNPKPSTSGEIYLPLCRPRSLS